MKSLHPVIILCTVFVFTACNTNDKNFDATGTFEAVETIISSEANGKILALNIEEGQELKAGEIIGYIDSTQLYLKKKQLQAQIASLKSKQPDIAVQLASLKEQLTTAEKEKIRIASLVKGNAATQKQLDDMDASIAVLKKQIAAQRSTLEITRSSIENDMVPMQLQIEQVDDQIKKCRIINPVKGTVLSKYAEEQEVTAQGKSLYKIADLSTVTLRAYVSGDQLPGIRLNQKVRVMTDNGQGGMTEDQGEIIWINDEAEFTPKSIQTKDERTNMVYAVKVKVVNNGTYKIGMYGELRF